MAFSYRVSELFNITDARYIRGQSAVILMTVALVIVLTKIPHISGSEHEHRVRDASGETLMEVWHTDCHRVCRHDLIEHVDVACRYDPYRIIGKRSVDAVMDPSSHSEHQSPSQQPTRAPSLFVAKDTSASFLKSYKLKRQAHSVYKRSIMDECCVSKACSWEEFAEFCHVGNRRPATHVTICYP
ncbi:probable insulin-like peptide 7 [Gigantopelta aegis]|uniref:probable insulin-like peptide 7 n=1 Tax=Gigantopelta aegis TaxID=1735272 RepID=UPI001B88A1B9|nr:probable insulin-like peptide 7 [Gigantopelta aegis]